MLCLLGMLLCSAPAVADEAKAATDPAPVLIEELYLADAALVQERGDVQFTFTALSLRPDGDRSDDLLLGDAELELGVTDRLELSVGTSLFEAEGGSLRGTFDEWEAGAAYDFARNHDHALIAAVSFEHGEEQTVAIRLAHRFSIRGAEVHSGVSAKVGEEAGFTTNVAAVVPLGRWRGSVELLHESREGGVRVAPAISWVRRGLQIGAALSSSHDAKPSLIVKAAFEF